MKEGFEAEVVRIDAMEHRYCMKVWSKEAKPDVLFQYEWLAALAQHNIPVPEPVGCGRNDGDIPVLLTTYEGTALQSVNPGSIIDMAMLLARVHRLPIHEISDVKLPAFDCIHYFFPGIDRHPDLHYALTGLIGRTNLRQDRCIHGDYHLGNVVEENGRLTIIDWTNAQAGDSRFDLAWSFVLMNILLSKRHASMFLSAYRSEIPVLKEELELFEGMALIRWVLLSRKGDVPREAAIRNKVASLMGRNRFLKELALAGFTNPKRSGSDSGMEIEKAFGQFPILESESILLKKIEVVHLDEVFEIYDNERVFTYCGIIPKHNKETVKNMIGHFERDFLKRTRIKWGIFAKQEPDRLLGIIEAFDWNQKVNSLSVGYFLAEQHYGKGIATEALRCLARFLLADVQVNRIQAEVMPPNEASIRVLLKNGFTKEGLLRQAAVWSGKGVVDLEIYSLLQTDDMQ